MEINIHLMKLRSDFSTWEEFLAWEEYQNAKCDYVDLAAKGESVEQASKTLEAAYNKWMKFIPVL